MSIIDTIRGLFAYLAGLFGGVESESTLEPSELIESLITCADEHAKRWGDQVDLPNYFEVRLPLIEWDAYYGSRVDQTEARLSRALTDYADQINACMAEPEVVVLVDSGLPCNRVTVSAAFTDSDGQAEWKGDPANDMRGEEEDSFGASRARRDVTPVFDMWGEREVPADPQVARSTPVLDTLNLRGKPDDSDTPVVPTASVCVPNGPSFEVSDGSTIGVYRDDQRELPTIVLPYAEGVRTCSQVQGVFNADDQGWLFTDKGRNGTRVRRGSETQWLDDAPYALKDDDVLFFGGSEVPAVVFHATVA